MLRSNTKKYLNLFFKSFLKSIKGIFLYDYVLDVLSSLFLSFSFTRFWVLESRDRQRT